MAGSEFTLCPRPGACHLRTSWGAWEGSHPNRGQENKGGRPPEAVLIWLDGRGGRGHAPKL